MASLAVVFDLIARDKASKAINDVGGAADKSGGRIGKLGKVIAGVAAGAVVAGGVAFAKYGTSAVNAFAAVEDATGAAGVQFGKALPQVLKFADTALDSFGLSKRAAIEAQNTFGTLGKSAGLAGKPLADFTGQFTGLAGDLASFKGTSTEQAIEAIGAALRGESEPIRAYGVLLDDASLRQEALAQGLIKTTKEALTPQQKVLATQALILKQTTDAQGDFARTSDSTANTQKRLQAATENAQAALGEKLAPALTAVRAAFLGLLQGSSKFVDYIAPAMSRVTAGFESFQAGLRGDGPVKGFTGAINTLGLGLRALVEAFRYGDVTSNGFVGKMEAVGDALFRLRPTLDTLKTAFGAFFLALRYGDVTSDGLVGTFERVGDTLHRLAPLIWSAVQVTGSLIAGFAGVIKNTPMPILKAVAAAVAALVAVLGTAVAINKTAAAATAAYTAVKAIFITTTNAETGAVTLSTVAKMKNTVSTAAGTVATVARTAVTALSSVAHLKNTATVVSNTVATTANTVATSAARVAMIAFTAAKAVGTAATVAMTAATTALGVAVRFALGPIGLAITAIGLLSAGIVYAYKNSDTFRAAVDKVWQALRTAGGWIKDTGEKVGTWIIDKFKAAKDRAQEFIDAVKGFVLPGWVKDMAGLLGSIGGGLKKGFDAVRGGFGDGPGIGGEGGQPRGVRAMMKALPPGTKLISGVRPGARTATGRQSYHALGRAVDLPPSRALFEYIRSNFGASSKELIFSPAGGRQLNNGKPHVYTGVTKAMHYDHIHWAMDRGGVANGIGFMPKLTSKPERVLSPRQTESFERLVNLLGRQRNRGIRAEDGSYVRRGFYQPTPRPTAPVSTAQFADNSALLLEIQRLRGDIRNLPRSYQFGQRAMTGA